MTKSFKGGVVVVTGGASGIGKALVTRFAELEAIVVMLDRDKEALQSLVAQLEVSGYKAQYEVVDMTIAEDVRRVFRQITSNHQKLDYVINCAGVFMGGEMRDTPLNEWHEIMHANIAPIINGTHIAYAAMLEQRSGHIVNISSVAGLLPVPAMGVYGASKYAVTGLTHALRHEAKKLGVRISVVCPTLVNTPLYDTARYHRVNTESALSHRGSFQTPEKAAEQIIKGIALNKRTIHTSRTTQLLSWLYLISPALYDVVLQRILKRYRLRLRIAD